MWNDVGKGVREDCSAGHAEISVRRQKRVPLEESAGHRTQNRAAIPVFGRETNPPHVSRMVAVPRNPLILSKQDSRSP